ncbi:F-box/LRR-repeat protein 4-like [Temnothorax nylanderi]|uniref:F-box/LRR-repeat protein 4-like n=1 Tax=Temnothorax nylanderi TaxID=102681 RepID=UPI003A8ABBD5
MGAQCALMSSPDCCSVERHPVVVRREEENMASHSRLYYQYVKKSSSIAGEYGGTNTGSIQYTSEAIIGPPNKYPSYGEFPPAFIMQTDGFNISSTSPWQKETHIAAYVNSKPQNDRTMYCNYIDLEFDEAVYPLRVCIYEVYNPGYVTEIWAQDFDGRWFQLWTAKPCRRQIVPSTSQIFSPPLQSFNFRTKIIRLKFMNSLWNYSTQLDAVQLIGTKQLIVPNNQQSLIDLLDNNCERSCHQDIMYNLTSDYKNVSDKSKEQSYGRNFDDLPNEILLKILKNLDVTSLCRMGRVDKRFNNLTRDPALFKCLKLRNLRPIKSTRINTYNNIIPYFESRCHFLEQLDLTSSDISVETFVKFLDNCGSRLTHLRLSNCPFVDDSVLEKISKVCKKLKVLDLSDLMYDNHIDEGFSHLKNIDCLEELNLNWTFVEIQPICEILRKNRGIRD